MPMRTKVSVFGTMPGIRCCMKRPNAPPASPPITWAGANVPPLPPEEMVKAVARIFSRARPSMKETVSFPSIACWSQP